MFKIAFTVSERADRWHLFFANEDGTGITNLTSDPAQNDMDPSWSRDGTEIAFTRYQGDQPGAIYAINVATRSPRTIASDPENTLFRPVWSPDGTKIAFLRRSRWSSPELGGSICLVSATGGDVRLFSSGNYTGLTWSPDGIRIAYADLENIYTVPVSESGIPVPITRITTNPGTSLAPAWSRNGLRIAFQRVYSIEEGSFRGEIWSMNVDGSEQERLATTTWEESQSLLMYGQPAWCRSKPRPYCVA